MTTTVPVQAILTLHQPLHATREAIAAQVTRCYEPLLALLRERPALRVGVHASGHLLDALAKNHESVLYTLRDLTQAGQIEVLGGLFYGGHVALLPEMDVRGQVEMMSEYWQSYLGAPPAGFWLPGYSWCPELPRMLQDSGLRYGYARDTQLDMDDDAHLGVGVLARGEERVAVFSVDTRLSSGLPSGDLDAWVEALLDRASGHPGRVFTVTLSADALASETGLDNDWLPRFLDALSGGREELRPLTPDGAYRLARPAAPWGLRLGEGEVDAVIACRRRPALATLCTRMLQVSDKLREAIAAMDEDEELGEEWSDELATAQRLLFAAQSPDAYALSGPDAPAARDAATQRLLEAAVRLDRLVQGDDDWIGTEEEDRDGDLVDEVYVSTARLTAWVVPGRGGEVRALDHRAWQRNVLDVAPFERTVAAMPSPAASSGELTTIDAAGTPRPDPSRLARIDPSHAFGIRSFVVEANTSAEEFDDGSAVDLLPSRPTWLVLESAIDEEGDCSYRLSAEAGMSLAGLSPRSLALKREITIPIDACEVRYRDVADLSGAPEIALITEIPLRLSQAAALNVGGEPVAATRSELHDVQSLTITGAEGELVTLAFSAPVDVWVLPGETGAHGIVLVVAWRVEGAGELSYSLRFGEAGGEETEEVEEEAADEGEVEPDEGDATEGEEEEYEGEEAEESGEVDGEEDET